MASAASIRAEHKFQFLSHYSRALSVACAQRAVHPVYTAKKRAASQVQTLKVRKLMYSIKVEDCNCRNYAMQTIPSQVYQADTKLVNLTVDRSDK